MRQQQTDDPRLLVAPEDAYRFGAGPLRLRVTALRPDLDTREGWRGVEGMEITEDGLEMEPRFAVVRPDVVLPFLQRIIVTPAQR